VQSKKVEIVLDRREAIKKAFASARKGDTVIITGKGSEEVLHVADGKTIPWNDKKVCEELLREFELRIISKKPAARIVETHKKKKARNV
jgi:UDP-N-acetylmuramoyl-L-alanyl-D-glutamate--2,6-diaminopimelate ligase